MKGLICGMGEVGHALFEVLARVHDMGAYDVKWAPGAASLLPSPDVLHICFPWSESFETTVGEYQRLLKPRYTVIHSTVPVGTSKRLGAYHSPVRGSHPQLAGALRAFTTYLAPPEGALVEYFREAGMQVETVRQQGDTEAGKLWCLTALALSVTLEKAVWRYCQERGLDYETVYRRFTESYNRGYAGMDRPELQRPVLKHTPGPIGGHCVIPGVEMLDSEEFANMVLALNEQWDCEVQHAW